MWSLPFVLQAASICPTDPVLQNELGVVAFRRRDFGRAARHFVHALGLWGVDAARLLTPAACACAGIPRDECAAAPKSVDQETDRVVQRNNAGVKARDVAEETLAPVLVNLGHSLRKIGSVSPVNLCQDNHYPSIEI